HTTAIMPYWARYLQQSAIVGSHIFYRWGGTAGEASAFHQRYGGLEPAPAFEAQPVTAAAEGTTVEAGVAVHVGTTTSATEQLSFEDGVVTVHRSGRIAAPQAAVATASAEPEQGPGPAPVQADTAAPSFGVTIHRGAAPTAG